MLALPLTGREVPIVADDWANPEFGTGAVKVTPAHDPNDFAIGQRHALPSLSILDKTARIDLPGSAFHGLDRYEARERIVAELDGLGLLVAVKDHPMTVPISQRSGSVNRAAAFRSVVPCRQQDAEPRRRFDRGQSDRRGERRPHPVHALDVREDLLRVDGQHPRLVPLAAAVVGTPHSGVALRRLPRP